MTRDPYTQPTIIEYALITILVSIVIVLLFVVMTGVA